MTVLEAPLRMGRRAQAKGLLVDLHHDLSGAIVEMKFPDDAYPTTSFVDEIIRAILVDRQADSLALVNANERVAEIALLCADDLGVRDRLTVR